MRRRTEVDLSRALGGILVTEMFVTTLIPPLFYANDSIGLSQSGPLAARLGFLSLLLIRSYSGPASSATSFPVTEPSLLTLPPQQTLLVPKQQLLETVGAMPQNPLIKQAKQEMLITSPGLEAQDEYLE
jgi:hypothetical protein